MENASSPVSENEIRRHQTRFMGSKFTKNAFAELQPSTHFIVYFRAQKLRLVAANVVQFLLNDVHKLKQVCLFLTVGLLYATVYSRLLNSTW